MLEADMPPEEARETIAADDEEKLRNIARIESALDIFGVLKCHKGQVKNTALPFSYDYVTL